MTDETVAEDTGRNIKLCPNFIVFKWSPHTHMHTLVKDDPEANIIEINKFIDGLNEDAYYAVFQKDYKGELYGIVAMIVSKGATMITKMMGYSTPRIAKMIDGEWWFQ